jgi:hypothetical protein
LCWYHGVFLLIWLCDKIWNQVFWSFYIPLFAQNCLALGCLLCFQMKFRVDFSISVMNVIRILMGIALSM